MSAREAIKAYLTFGRKDRIGIIGLVLLIATIYTLPYLLPKKSGPFPAKESSLLVAAIDTLASKQKNNRQISIDETENEYRYQPTASESYESGELFQFDPNTLSFEGWRRLGLSERTSRTIDNYRNKGGKFYKPEDIQKIWGLPASFYNRVKNYIIITSLPTNYGNSSEKYTKPEKKVLVVDINVADTSAFIALPGIGSKLASRIINFRDRLGGFYSVEQVGETYGLPDSTFQMIKGSLQLSGSVKKLHVNTATKDDLKVHPYIRWNLANAIVEYRNQHGNFKTVDELKNISLVDEIVYNKIIHYLDVN
jgi:competence protein ComEA